MSDEIIRHPTKTADELLLCTCGHRKWLHEGRKIQRCTLAGCHSCQGFEQGKEE